MKTAFRTARPRRVAVLTVLGLVTAGAIVAACVHLHARADTVRGAQLDLLHVEGSFGVMQKLPGTVQNRRSLAPTLQEIERLALSNQRELARIATIDERDDLVPAARLERRNATYLMTEATLVAQGHRLEADALASRYEQTVDAEWARLIRAEADLGRHAERAETIADDSAIAAVALALAVCVLLFWRLLRTNATATSAQRFAESLVESSVDGIFAFDREQRYHVWNGALERQLGISRRDAIGRRPEATPLALDEEAMAAREAALRGETVELRNERLDLPGLGERTFDVVYAPLHDAHGRIVGGLGHTRDVTERNELERELRETHKLEAIGQLAGGIAHDFNNLLMGIGGHASLALSRGASDDPALRHDLEEIWRASGRGGALTEQLLFFAGQGDRPPAPVDLSAVVTNAVELLERLLDPVVSIELELTDPAWVLADGAQLEQVVLSLGTNAREAMPDGGRLVIRTHSREPGQVQLAVSDTGAGIPEEIRSRIFEPFFTTKPAGQGTGLGLASAYGIITQAGGTIELESELGRGTTFTVTLPAAAPAEPAAAAGGAAGGGRILLVEDNPVVRGVVAAGLEEQGHTVFAAAMPADALAYVHGGGRFDLLVTDVVMPELGGGELADRLRAATDGTFGTVYMSGYPASGFRLDARSAFLQKPFELADLYALVARLRPRSA
jgi:PAS domain S-box-containing protein